MIYASQGMTNKTLEQFERQANSAEKVVQYNTSFVNIGGVNGVNSNVNLLQRDSQKEL